jgi:hypothetical protein
MLAEWPAMLADAFEDIQGAQVLNSAQMYGEGNALRSPRSMTHNTISQQDSPQNSSKKTHFNSMQMKVSVV